MDRSPVDEPDADEAECVKGEDGFKALPFIFCKFVWLFFEVIGRQNWFLEKKRQE
jgi:hypothetical protein